MKKKQSALTLMALTSIMMLGSCNKSSDNSSINHSTNQSTSTVTTPTNTSNSSSQAEKIAMKDAIKKVTDFIATNPEVSQYEWKNGTKSYTSKASTNEFYGTSTDSSTGVSSATLFGVYGLQTYNADITKNSSGDITYISGDKCTIGNSDSTEDETITISSFNSKLANKKSSLFYNFSKSFNQYFMNYFNSGTIVFVQDKYEYNPKTNTYYFEAYDEGYSTTYYMYESFEVTFDSDENISSAVKSERRAYKNGSNWDLENHKIVGSVTPSITSFDKISYDVTAESSNPPSIFGKYIEEYYLKQNSLSASDVSIVNRSGSTTLTADDYIEVKVSDSIKLIGKSSVNIISSSDTSIVGKVGDSWFAAKAGTATLTIGTAKFLNMLTVNVTISAKAETISTIDEFTQIYSYSSDYTVGWQEITVNQGIGINGDFELAASSNSGSSSTVVYAPYVEGTLANLKVGVANDDLYSMKTDAIPSGFSFSFSQKTSRQNQYKEAIYLTISMETTVAKGSYPFGIAKTGYTSGSTPLMAFYITVA